MTNEKKTIIHEHSQTHPQNKNNGFIKQKVNGQIILSQKTVLIALFIPILALIALTFYKRQKVLDATTVILPIELNLHQDDQGGYLLGYSLDYKVQYGVDSICQPPLPLTQMGKQDAYVCLKPKAFSYQKPNGCDLMIKGFCVQDEFYAGIESYDLKEEVNIQQLKERIKSNKLEVVLSISENGKALVRDILINGHSL